MAQCTEQLDEAVEGEDKEKWRTVAFCHEQVE